MKRLLLKVLCVLGYHDPEVKISYRGDPSSKGARLFVLYQVVCLHCGKELMGK